MARPRATAHLLKTPSLASSKKSSGKGSKKTTDGREPTKKRQRKVLPSSSSDDSLPTARRQDVDELSEETSHGRTNEKHRESSPVFQSESEEDVQDDDKDSSQHQDSKIFESTSSSQDEQEEEQEEVEEEEDQECSEGSDDEEEQVADSVETGTSSSETQVKKQRVSKSRRAGLVMPVFRVHRYLKQSQKGFNISAGSSVYLAATLEYLTSEVLELAGNCAHQLGKKTITPRHIQLAIRSDKELDQLLDGVTISGGGTLPGIHPALLPKSKDSM